MDERDHKAMNEEINSKPITLQDILRLLDVAHNHLAKSSLPKDEYNPISLSLIDTKRKLYKAILKQKQ